MSAAEFGKPPGKILRPSDSVPGRERHRFPWPIELDRDYHERLSVARLRAVSGDLRLYPDRHLPLTT